MNADRVKQIVSEAKGELAQGNEHDIRARVQQAIRRREQLDRRIKSVRGDLSDLETEAQLLDKALAAADNGDVSELPELPSDPQVARSPNHAAACCLTPSPTWTVQARAVPGDQFVQVPAHVGRELLGRLLATG